MVDRVSERLGQQFGNYRLERLLGRGGFAEVYLGKHVYLNTFAAIKILHTQLAADEQGNFLNEARTIAALIHPNIIRVLDFGMHNDLPFLVMDYAPNGSLRDRHPKQTRVPLDVVTSYVRQVADALQYAHNEKLIHRDVKPENMLVGRNGEILLTDFGISIVAQTSQSERTQDIIGSLPYMAPEQLQGKARPASDQYALGVTAYEWLCGDRPFHGSLNELYSQQLLSPPPSLCEKLPALPVAVERAIMLALAKDPHARFASVHAFASALLQASTTGQLATDAPVTPAFLTPFYSEPTVAHSKESAHSATTLLPDHSIETAPTQPRTPQPSRPSRRSIVTSAAGVAGLALLGGGIAWFANTHSSQGPASGHPAATPTPNLPSVPVGTLIYKYTQHGDTILSVAWSPDNSRIASASADNTVQVWDATTGQHLLVYRQHTKPVLAVAWSPNGKRIASASADNTVQVWDAHDGSNQIVYKKHATFFGYTKGVYALAWSHDGRYLASGGYDSTVHVWDAAQADPQPIIMYKGHFHFGFGSQVHAIAWSPDDTRIASGAEDNTAMVWDAQTGNNAFTYNKHHGYVLAIAWSHDGLNIASASADQTVHIWGAISGGHASIYTGHHDEVLSVAWSRDDKHLASAGKDQTVQIWQPGSTGADYSYSQQSQTVETVAWASDNHRVASGGDDQIVQVWEAL